MKVAFLARHAENTVVNDQHEALRSTLGLAAEMIDSHFFLLDHELVKEVAEDQEYKERYEMLTDELEEEVFSNVKENEKHGYKYLTTEEIAKKLKEYDLVIPYGR
ncbi:MAG: hypothetical protein J7J44_01480 [Deltaproteobacteria bacterium]|nr:hypothetical protein [Deltaproteobacteria bacterium]